MIKKRHDLLDDNQYYHSTHKKERIVLHHTAGGDAMSSIKWWNKYKDHVCTPYIIDREGSVYELFPPQYWAYALGVNSSLEEKKSIHVEICSYGWLNKIEDKYYTSYGTPIHEDKVLKYNDKHRGHLYYEKYTDAQVESTIYLIDYLSKEFDIKVKDVEKFWWYDRQSKKTLISHTTLRKDKSDIHPQPNLIREIYNYAECKAPITE